MRFQFALVCGFYYLTSKSLFKRTALKGIFESFKEMKILNLVHFYFHIYIAKGSGADAIRASHCSIPFLPDLLERL